MLQHHFINHIKKKKDFGWETYPRCDSLQIFKFLSDTSPLGLENLQEARSVFVEIFEELWLHLRFLLDKRQNSTRI